MIKSTVCYLIHDGKWLMLLRNKKQHDLNYGKWIGIGGKLKKNETPYECMVREVTEETGYHSRHNIVVLSIFITIIMKMKKSMYISQMIM